MSEGTAGVRVPSRRYSMWDSFGIRIKMIGGRVISLRRAMERWEEATGKAKEEMTADDKKAAYLNEVLRVYGVEEGGE